MNFLFNLNHDRLFYHGDAIGPCAVLHCEPRQVRKEAAVTMDAGAQYGE